MSSAQPFSRLARDVRTGAVLIAGLSAAVAVHAQNRIVYVDASAPIGGNGQSWQTAYNDLQTALLLVIRNNTPSSTTEFRISGGRFTPDLGTDDRTIPFLVQQGDRLIGGYAGRLNGDPDDHDPDRFATVLTGDLAHNDSPAFSNRSDNSFSLARIEQRTLSVSSAPSLTTLFRGLTMEGSNGMAQSLPVIDAFGFVSIARCIIRDHATRTLVGGSLETSAFSTSISGNRSNDALLQSASQLRNVRIQGNQLAEASGFALIEIGTSSYLSQALRATLVSDNSGYAHAVLLRRQTSLNRCTFAGNTLTTSVLWQDGAPTGHSISNCIIAENTIASGNPPLSLPFCEPAMLTAPNIFGAGTADIVIPGSPGCSFNFTPIADAHPFVDRDGPDNIPSTWQDNDFRPRLNGPAIDRANFSTLTSPSFGTDDAFLNFPFDVPSVPNLGSGISTFADIGAVEYIPASNSTPTCPADFNRSGAVTVQDVFDYLTAYFGGCP